MSNVNQLARDFVQSTIRIIGTNEQKVYSILSEVHSDKISDEFKKEVEGLLTEEEKNRFTYTIGKSGFTADLTQNILLDEMSGPEYWKAFSFYSKGEYKPNREDSIVSGVMRAFDWSNSGRQIFSYVGGRILIAGVFGGGGWVFAAIGIGVLYLANKEAINNGVVDIYEGLSSGEDSVVNHGIENLSYAATNIALGLVMAAGIRKLFS